MDKTVAVFKKNKFQEIRVGIREFKGNDLIDIRTWTMTQGSDEMVPTAKGVSLNISLLSELRKAIDEVERVLKENKMIWRWTSTMNIKPFPNHRVYIQTIRAMGPEKRLLKAFELSEFSKELFREGLYKRFPRLSAKKFQKYYLERLSKCYNRNY